MPFIPNPGEAGKVLYNTITTQPDKFCDFCTTFIPYRTYPISFVTNLIPYRTYPYPTEHNLGRIDPNGLCSSANIRFAS